MATIRPRRQRSLATRCHERGKRADVMIEFVIFPIFTRLGDHFRTFRQRKFTKRYSRTSRRIETSCNSRNIHSAAIFVVIR
jgi:hypothetical protein